MKYKAGTGVVAREPGSPGRIVKGVTNVYDLALAAAETGVSLAEKVHKQGLSEEIDLERIYADGEMLSPVNHRSPANLHLTGTGLTHLGSVATRDAMHKMASSASRAMSMSICSARRHSLSPMASSPRRAMSSRSIAPISACLCAIH